MAAEGWLETYRGTVHRWEVDNVDHFTVAYYLERVEHATLNALRALGLDGAAGRACVPAGAYVRYARELRAGDLLHIASGVLDAGPEGVALGHRLVNSDTGAVCATVEMTTRQVELATWQPVPLAVSQQQAALARRVAWDGPARESRREPGGLDGLVAGARDTVLPREVNLHGVCGLAGFIHRFSAASGQVLNAFGMSPAYQREHRRGFSTFEFQLRWTGVLRPGDTTEVRSALVHVGTSSVHIFHVLRDGRGAPVASLHQLGVHLDMDARRPAPLPEGLREKARALLTGPA